MKKEKSSRRQEQAAETKRRLYDSAAQLFGQYDYDEVTIDAIVQSAGVSKGSFYVHFPSKAALIDAFLSDYINGLDVTYQSFIVSLPPGIKSSEQLLTLAAKVADVLTDTIGYNRMRTAYKMQLTKAVNMETVLNYQRDLYKIFAEILRQGLTQGEFQSELSPDALTRYFVMAIRGLSYEWCIRYPDFDLKKECLEYFRILLKGIQSSEIL